MASHAMPAIQPSLAVGLGKTAAPAKPSNGDNNTISMAAVASSNNENE
jgi:hypothetical protein